MAEATHKTFAYLHGLPVPLDEVWSWVGDRPVDVTVIRDEKDCAARAAKREAQLALEKRLEEVVDPKERADLREALLQCELGLALGRLRRAVLLVPYHRHVHGPVPHPRPDLVQGHGQPMEVGEGLVCCLRHVSRCLRRNFPGIWLLCRSADCLAR